MPNQPGCPVVPDEYWLGLLGSGQVDILDNILVIEVDDAELLSPF